MTTPYFVLPDVSQARFAILDCASLGALVRLWSYAWASGGRVPEAESSLAAIAGITVDSWRRSELAGNLDKFLPIDDPAGSGKFRLAVDLLDQLERRRRTSGARSAAAKARWGRPSCKMHDANALQMQCKSTALAFPVGQPIAAPAADPTPATTCARKDVADTLDATMRAQPAALCAPLSPPIPPSITPHNPGSGFSSGDAQEEEQHQTDTEVIEGVQGGKEDAVQLDLFGGAAEMDRPRRRARPTAEQSKAAQRLCGAYDAKVGPKVLSTNRAASRAARALQQGFTEQTLLACIVSYATACDADETEAKFRQSASSFFGDGTFRHHLEARVIPEPKSQAKPKKQSEAWQEALDQWKQEEQAGRPGQSTTPSSTA